jgi:uroporphyrinogen-III synthase
LNLLVIRPEPDGERTAGALRARGHHALLAPLTRIASVATDLGPGPWAALLITSANAVRALENHPQRQKLSGLAVLAVGDRSAAAARHAGFTDVTSADGTAADLAALAASRYGGTGRPLLWLAGADRAADLAAALASSSVPVEMRVIYQSVANTDLPPSVAEALREGTLGGVLHYSRRSAEAYLAVAARAALAEQALRPMQFCLSARIAEPLAAAGAPDIRISPRPTEESLLQLVDSA